MKKYMTICLLLTSLMSCGELFAQNAAKHKMARRSTPCNTLTTAPKRHHRTPAKYAAKHSRRTHPVPRPVQETIAVDDRMNTAIVSIKNGDVYINDSLVTTIKNAKNEDHRLIINYIAPPPPPAASPVTENIEQLKINTYTGEKAEPMLGVLGSTFYDEGVIVDELLPWGPAPKGGLYPGDVITKIDDRDIKNAGDLKEAINSHNPGDNITITVKDIEGSSTKQVELMKKDLPETCGCVRPYMDRW
jgi:sRNA-binding carbon storage regulator CsrA